VASAFEIVDCRAGWAEEEDRLRAVDRRPELTKREVRKHEMRERFAKTLKGDLYRADRLRAHASDVRRERTGAAPTYPLRASPLSRERRPSR